MFNASDGHTRTAPPLWLAFFVVLSRVGIALAGWTHPLLCITADSHDYLSLADTLAHHAVFSRSDAAPWLPEIIRLPGYPLFLAAFTAMPGYPVYIVGAMQCLIAIMTLWFVWQWLARTSTETAATVGTFVVAADLVPLFHQPMVLSETVFIAVLLMAISTLWKAVRNPDVWVCFFAGLLWGAATLIRPVFYYFPPIISLVWWQRKRALAAFLVGAYLLPGAWVARNGIKASFWGFTGLEGEVLLRYPAASVYAMEKHVSFEEAQHLLMAEATQPLGPWADIGTRSKACGALAKQWMLGHPWETFLVCVHGSVRVLLGTGLEMLVLWLGYTPLSAPPTATITGQSTFLLMHQFHWLIPVEFSYLALLLFAYGAGLWGVIVRWREGRHAEAYLILMACAYVVAISAHQGYYRFRIPMMPFVAAGVAAWMQSRSRRPLSQ